MLDCLIRIGIIIPCCIHMVVFAVYFNNVPCMRRSLPSVGLCYVSGGFGTLNAAFLHQIRNRTRISFANYYYHNSLILTKYDLNEIKRFAAELLLGDSASFYREMQDSDYTLFQIAAVHHVPYDFLAYKLQMMEEEGYPVPELPAEPDSRCLGGDLGLPDCYGFYEE